MRPRLDSLTGLRFVAALLVFGLHANLLLGLPTWLAPVRYGFGVTFFRILSGFVLTWSRRPHESVGRFYWNRFARIWPLHALTTVFALLPGRPPAAAGALWLDLSFAGEWMPSLPVPLNRPSWTIAVEAFFYATFPLLVLSGAFASRRDSCTSSPRE